MEHNSQIQWLKWSSNFLTTTQRKDKINVSLLKMMSLSSSMTIININLTQSSQTLKATTNKFDLILFLHYVEILCWTRLWNHLTLCWSRFNNCWTRYCSIHIIKAFRWTWNEFLNSSNRPTSSIDAVFFIFCNKSCSSPYCSNFKHSS